MDKDTKAIVAPSWLAWPRHVVQQALSNFVSKANLATENGPALPIGDGESELSNLLRRRTGLNNLKNQ